jgi:hypothetical protein
VYKKLFERIAFLIFLFVDIVHYHVDQCTKNKYMIWIPTHGLFLTYTKSPFLSCTYNMGSMPGAYLLKEKKEKNYLTWKGGPCLWWGIPILSGHLLKSPAFMPLPFLHPPHPLPAKKDIYLHTDDINMPAAHRDHKEFDSKHICY